MKKVKINNKCLICKKSIKEEEFNFEDYFKVFRGNNNLNYSGDKGLKGFICFRCLKETKFKGVF